MDKEKIAEELVRKHKDFKSEGLSEYMNGYLNGAIAALEHIEQAGIYSNVSGKRLDDELVTEMRIGLDKLNDCYVKLSAACASGAVDTVAEAREIIAECKRRENCLCGLECKLTIEEVRSSREGQP